MTESISTLLRELRAASPEDRIALRPAFLKEGPSAIESLRDFALANPDLGPGIVATIERIAQEGADGRPKAIAALRGLYGTDADTGRHAGQALERLGAAPEVVAKPKSGGSPVRRAAGTEWTGFQAHEFGQNARTSWRSATGRVSLAPLLTRSLQGLDPDFMSFGVERSPEIHFAVSRRYRGEVGSGVTASKLVVYAEGPTQEAPTTRAEVVAGYYLERGNGQAPFGDSGDSRRWDWPLFLAAARQEWFADAVTSLMARHGLSFGDYIGGRFFASVGWVAVVEDGSLVARSPSGEIAARGWTEVIDSLDALPADQWIGVHLVRSWPADDAIGAGQMFASREVLPVLTDLGRLYLRILGTV